MMHNRKKLWKIKGTLLSLLLMLLSPMAALGWEFSEDEFTDGLLRYAIDQAGTAVECRGLAEGTLATQVTVPATVSHNSKTYSVVSIAAGAFLRATTLTQVSLLSPQLQVGAMPFNTSLQRLVLSAAVPPPLDFYLIIDPENPLSAITETATTRIVVPQGAASAYLQHEWWGKYIIIEGEELQLSITTTRGGMLAESLSMRNIPFGQVNHLTVDGPLNDADLYFISDSLAHLLSLDLRQARCSSLPRNCFVGCIFSTVHLPTTLRRIGAGAFTSCRQLEELVVPEGVELLEGSGTNNAIILNCPRIHHVDLPSTLAQASASIVYRISWSDEEAVPLTITCRSFFPPKVNGLVVYQSMGSSSDVTIRVPEVSASLYAADSKWSDFSRQTITDRPSVLQVYSPRTIDPSLLPAGYTPDVMMGTFITEDYNYRSENFGKLTVSGTQPFHAGKVTLYANLPKDRFNSNHYSSELLLATPMSADQTVVSLLVGEGRWYFLSFPFDVRLDQVELDSDIRHWVVRQYSARNRAIMRGDQWIDVPYGSTLKANQGYIWRFSSTDDAEATQRNNLSLTIRATDESRQQLFSTGTVSIPLTDRPSTYEHNASWNLVGNPFPCYVDTRQLSPAVPFTVWNSVSSEYRTYSPVDDKYVLAPYEPFFLQKPTDVAAVSVPHPLSTAGSRTPTATAAAPRQLVNLTLQADSLADVTRVVLNPDAATAYERTRDAAKFFSPEQQRPQLYSLIGTTACSINERPEADGRIVLGMRTASATHCTLSLADSSATVMLEDLVCGTLTDLSQQAYDFLSRPGTDDTRFVLHVGAAATSITTVVTTTPATRFNTLGQSVDNRYRGIVVSNRKLFISK